VTETAYYVHIVLALRLPRDTVGQCGPTTDHGPPVARHNVSSGPPMHSGKTFKSEICWKACEVTFVSLYYLHWIKWICTRTIPFFCVPFCLFVCFTIN